MNNVVDHNMIDYVNSFNDVERLGAKRVELDSIFVQECFYVYITNPRENVVVLSTICYTSR